MVEGVRADPERGRRERERAPRRNRRKTAASSHAPAVLILRVLEVEAERVDGDLVLACEVLRGARREGLVERERRGEERTACAA